MAALTADRLVQRRADRDFAFPAKAATIYYAGGLVCIDTATGNAVRAITSTTLRAVGIARDYVDNSLGADGDKNVPVERGCFKFLNSASTDLIARTEIGTQCYIVDDQTVAKTSAASTRSVAGVVRDVDATGVWVEI